jgi:hypothetical protein
MEVKADQREVASEMKRIREMVSSGCLQWMEHQPTRAMGNQITPRKQEQEA